jgi:hypothetical protein
MMVEVPARKKRKQEGKPKKIHDADRFMAILAINDMAVHYFHTETFKWSRILLDFAVFKMVVSAKSFVYKATRDTAGLHAFIFLKLSVEKIVFLRLTQPDIFQKELKLEEIKLNSSTMCQCSVENLFNNGVIDQNTKLMYSLCAHCNLYKGVVEQNTFKWILCGNARSEGYMPRTLAIQVFTFAPTKKLPMMFILGGISLNDEILNDVWLLNISNCSLSKIPIDVNDSILSLTCSAYLHSSGGSSKIQGHEGFKLNHSLYLFVKTKVLLLNMQLGFDATGKTLVSCEAVKIVHNTLPEGNIRRIDGFIPKGHELLFFMQYENDLEGTINKIQVFRFDDNAVEIENHFKCIDSLEDYQMAINAVDLSKNHHYFDEFQAYAREDIKCYGKTRSGLGFETLLPSSKTLILEDDEDDDKYNTCQRQIEELEW